MSGCRWCDGCEGCDSCQSFCQQGYQTVGSFDFGQCVSEGQIFLTKENWNKLLKYINDAYAAGRMQNGGNSGLPSDGQDPDIYMTASMFNKVSLALRSLGSNYRPLDVSKGDVILGEYFESLENYANNLEYKNSQCDYCNISCDSGCDNNKQAHYCCSYCNNGLG